MIPKWRLFEASTNDLFSATLLDNWWNLSEVTTKDHDLSSKRAMFILRVHSLHEVLESVVHSLTNEVMGHRGFTSDNDLGSDQKVGKR